MGEGNSYFSGNLCTCTLFYLCPHTVPLPSPVCAKEWSLSCERPDRHVRCVPRSQVQATVASALKTLNIVDAINVLPIPVAPFK